MSLSAFVPEVLPTNLTAMMIDLPDMIFIINTERMECLNDSENFFSEIDVTDVLNMEPDLQFENFTDMDISINPNNVGDIETALNLSNLSNVETENYVMDTEITINRSDLSNNLFNETNMESNFTQTDLAFINVLGLLFDRYISENNDDEDDIYSRYELPVAVIDLLLSLQNEPQPQPVPENVLNNLPIIKVDVNQSAKNEQCPICLDYFKLEDKAMLLPCNHSYHENCVRLWFTQQNHCPVCRQEV